VVLRQPVNAGNPVGDFERLTRMLNTSHIDKKKLWQKVESVLEKKTTASLSEIIADAGLEHGIAEVVGYFSFLREKSGRVHYMQETTELIPLNAERTQFLEVPYLIFAR
jgi:hypothetical protein